MINHDWTCRKRGIGRAVDDVCIGDTSLFKREVSRGDAS